MSRIGKLPVVLGKGVEFKMADGIIAVKGPKGEVKTHVLDLVKVEFAEGKVSFSQVNDSRESNANTGTMRALVNDMNKGVTVGFNAIGDDEHSLDGFVVIEAFGVVKGGFQVGGAAIEGFVIEDALNAIEGVTHWGNDLLVFGEGADADLGVNATLGVDVSD